MIFTWVLVTLAWCSLIAAFDFGGFILPDLPVAISIWAGLRVFRRHEDMWLAITLGLVAGLFSVDPWFFAPLICLTAVVLTSGMRGRLAPQSLLGRSLVVTVVFLGLGVLEIVIRMSVPSLILDSNTAFGIGCRIVASIPLAIFLDQVTPQR